MRSINRYGFVFVAALLAVSCCTINGLLFSQVLETPPLDPGDVLFNPPPFDSDEVPFHEGPLRPPSEMLGRDQEDLEPDWIPSSVEKFEEILAGEYSDEHHISFRDLPEIMFGSRRMPRATTPTTSLELRFFVADAEEYRLKHGVVNKGEVQRLESDSGIPVDAHPQAIIIFPPQEEGMPEIVRQYPLKGRC